MKKFFKIMFMAVFSVLSACQTALPQEDEGVQCFIATIGSDTKTSLSYDPTRDVYKVFWEEGDEILVVDAETGDSELCPIIEGVGTSKAKFAGTLKAKKYYAIYGDNVSVDDNVPEVFVSPTQYGSGGIRGSRFQMFAQSSTRSFSFQNLYSLIKINVKAEDGEYLRDLTLTTNDPGMEVAGDARIYMKGNAPYLDFSSGQNNLKVNAYSSLSARPTPIYVMLPPQTYSEGFTLEFNLDSGVETVTVTDDVVMNRSSIRNLNVNLSDGSYEQPEKSFSLVMSTDSGESWEWFSLSDEGSFFVLRDVYMPEGTLFCFWEDSESEWYYCSNRYRTSDYKTNSRVNLVAYTDADTDADIQNFSSAYEATYDIYVDPVKCCVFVMTADDPYALPTMGMAIHDDYETIADTPDNTLVKIHGIVLAENEVGYIVAIDRYYYNNVFVYDPNGLLDLTLGCVVDMYAVTKTNNGMKQLVIDETVLWYYIMVNQYKDYEPEPSVRIDYLSSYNSLTYENVNVSGRLEMTKNSQGQTKYTLKVTGPEKFDVDISQPLQDLSQYNGKNVLVEGYHLGHNASNSTPTLKIMLKRIWEDDSISGGSTENVLPGGPIIVTNN